MSSTTTTTATTPAPAAAAAAKKLWGGRFSGATDPLFESFNESIHFDRVLCHADVRGSQAYARALARSGVLTGEEAEALVKGLAAVDDEWRAGTFEIKAGDEDIHTANERRLGELIGALAGKLHTGRSRNDQVATDMRLWCLDEVDALAELLDELIGACVRSAKEHADVLMPGFTHLQPAQVIRYSHWILSHAFALERDAQRLRDLRKRVSVMPLGSGALAGNPFGVDRAWLAQELKFDAVSPNSLDAVSNRDFVAEFLFWASLTMVHISQVSEDLIIFASKKYVVIADAYSTGSSLMPQKKNPDACELLRGKTGRVVGALTGILSVLKAMPRAYNKDLQEDKEGLFDAAKTLRGCIPICAGVVATLRPHEANLRAALSADMLATDLAEYLVRKGVPFRETHHIAGAAVKMAEDRKVQLSELSVADLRTLHDKFEEDVARVWDFETSAESRATDGGTARKAIQKQIDQLEACLAERASSSGG